MSLREMRHRRKLTQEQLADLAGVDQATISTLEGSTDPNPTWKTANRLAKALRAKPTDLFPSEEPAAEAQSR